MWCTKRRQILVAEGEKEAAILKADAEKQAAILRAEAEKESAKSCKKAIQYIGTEHCLFDIKTHHQGTLSVSTNGIQLTAEFEIFQKHCNNENYDNCDHHCRRNVCRDKFTFFVCRTKWHVETVVCPFQEYFVFDGDHVCTDDCCHTTSEEHAGKCYDKWLDSHVSYQKSLYDTKSKADQKCCKNCHICTHAFVFHKVCHYHADKCCYRTNGDINTTGDHNDRQATGNNEKTCI